MNASGDACRAGVVVCKAHRGRPRARSPGPAGAGDGESDKWGPRLRGRGVCVTVASLRLTETCTSCGVRLLGKGVTTFLCPSCGESKMGRCAQCRDQSVTYTCNKCGFAGP